MRKSIKYSYYIMFRLFNFNCSIFTRIKNKSFNFCYKKTYQNLQANFSCFLQNLLTEGCFQHLKFQWTHLNVYDNKLVLQWDNVKKHYNKPKEITNKPLNG